MSKTLYQNKPGAPFQIKVIIATEAAESSLTFDNLDTVIDTGTVKNSRFHPLTGLQSLNLEYVNQASHRQRKGRVGRVKKGFCYNIFTRKEYDGWLKYAIPPICISDITDYILRFMSEKYVSNVSIPFHYKKKYSEFDVDKTVPLDEFLFNMLASPKEEFVSYSIRQLFSLGALTQAKKNTLEINSIGKDMLRFHRLQPILAKSLLVSYDYLANSPKDRMDDVLIIAALMELTGGRFSEKLYEREPRTYGLNKTEATKIKNDYNKARKKLSSKYGDFISALNVFHILKKISHPPNRENMNNQQKGDLTRTANVYAKKHFIKSRFFKDAISLVANYRKDLNRLASKRKDRIYFDKHYNGNAANFDEFIQQVRSQEISLNKSLLHGGHVYISDDSYVFPRDAPNSHINNVLLSIFNGLFVNYATKAGKNRYKNCYHKERSTAELDRFSFVSKMKTQPKNIVYYKYDSNAGRKRFDLITAIPKTVLDKAPESIRSLLAHCSKNK